MLNVRINCTATTHITVITAQLTALLQHTLLWLQHN